nr:biliverdin-producing heme oxygenase [uncultured Flavobacterium sp.]
MNNSSILKNQTQDLHHNVERVMNSELLFSDQFTVEHYKNFVLKLYNYIETILNIDTEFLNEYQTILKQKKIALQTDLDHLNINQNQVVIHAVNNTNAHHHLGLVYIVLGLYCAWCHARK